MGLRRAGSGMTLIELLIAVTVGAIVLAALNSVVSLGLRAETTGRKANELVFGARFALERIVATARAMPPKLLAAPAAGTTGDWFSPVMFCLNGAGQLIETTTADSGCTGTASIAANVTAFSAQLPASTGAVDRPLAVLSLTLVQSSVPKTVSLSTSVRLGGGTL